MFPNKLTDEDVRTLQTFSMYIQSYGSKVARTQLEVGSDNEFYEDIYGWSGDGSRMTIPTYEAIDELILRITQEENFVEKYFGYDDRGNITPIINASDKTLSFSADIYVTLGDPVGGTFYSEDLPEFVLNWMRGMRETESYQTASIEYQGSGDDGYLESDMYVNGKPGYSCPEPIHDWLIERITGFGDWYNNEGGQGGVHIDFINEEVSIEGELNYESEETNKLDYYASFK
jgi:hypothetical protein